MALITRLGRLFKADMHAVIDRLEAPDVLLKQAVREMEEAVAAGQRALAGAEADRKRIGARLAELTQQRERIGDELDLCFEAGNEPLARVLLRRRLHIDRGERVLTQQAEALDADIASRRETLESQRRRLGELRDKAEVFEVAPEPGEDAFTTSGQDISDADVELALLAEKRRRAS
ncbi:MAG TPA: PspA/IM30 family protein [Xanthomonadaceae bacterium]|nr:PspA/IM30 family protein [Xanthomonadaceae bacterium]